MGDPKLIYETCFTADGYRYYDIANLVPNNIYYTCDVGWLENKTFCFEYTLTTDRSLSLYCTRSIKIPSVKIYYKTVITEILETEDIFEHLFIDCEIKPEVLFDKNYECILSTNRTGQYENMQLAKKIGSTQDFLFYIHKYLKEKK